MLYLHAANSSTNPEGAPIASQDARLWSEIRKPNRSLLLEFAVDIQVFWWEGTRTTLVSALAFCYTGFGTKMSRPCAQEMWKIGEPR